MKTFAKSFLFGLGRRSLLVPWLVNFSAHSARSIKFLRSRYEKWDWTYQSVEVPLGSNPQVEYYNDVALNFFSRLVLEHHYDFVIEVGAYTGNRSMRLARLFPTLRIYALDVTKDYEPERSHEGITVAPNTLANVRRFSSQGGRGLLCSSGTLAYYEPDDVATLLTESSQLGLDLAIAEPNTVGEGSLTHSIKRNQQSRYHPYLQTLWRLKYVMPDNGGQQPGDCIADYGDARTYIFARHPSNVVNPTRTQQPPTGSV